MKLYEISYEICETLPQCSRSSSWKELSSSWISSGQGQSSPALKFNRMLICRRQTNRAIRLEEQRIQKGIQTRCFREQEGTWKEGEMSKQACERISKKDVSMQRGEHHYYSESHSTAELLMQSPAVSTHMGFSDSICLIDAKKNVSWSHSLETIWMTNHFK